MVLIVVQTAWNLLLLCLFVILPICFVYNYFKCCADIKKAQETETQEAPMAEPAKVEAASEPSYRTIKNEPGSYIVVGPKRQKASVIKVEAHDQKKYWIALYGDKKSDRAKTKKEAVELAIELIKQES